MAFNFPAASQTDSEIGVGLEFLPFRLPSDHEPPANSKLNLNAADHFAYEGNNHNGSDASFPTMIDSAELFAFLLLSAASCFYRVPWR